MRCLETLKEDSIWLGLNGQDAAPGHGSDSCRPLRQRRRVFSACLLRPPRRWRGPGSPMAHDHQALFHGSRHHQHGRHPPRGRSGAQARRCRWPAGAADPSQERQCSRRRHASAQGPARCISGQGCQVIKRHPAADGKRNDWRTVCQRPWARDRVGSLEESESQGHVSD